MIQEPTQPTLTPPPSTRRSSGIKIGLIIAAILLLAVPIVVAVAANSAPDANPLTAGASAAPAVTGATGASGAPDPAKTRSATASKDA